MNFTAEQREEMAKWGNKDIYALLEDIGELEEALRVSRDDADAQRMLAQNFSDAFASKPDQQFADGLEEYIGELKAELTNARSAMQEAHRERNFMVLRQWLEQHPEPEK